MPLTSSQIEDVIVTNSYLKSTFINVLNLHLQNETSQKAVISALNKLLSASKTRSQGLEYLNLILNECSIEVICQNALNWINHCMVKYPGDNLKEVKLISIGNIIKHVYKDQDFMKRFVSEYLNKVLEMCLSSHENPNEIKASLETLMICMKSYASWFTSHKPRIETFLLQYLENTMDPIVGKAAEAFHFLQQVGGGGIDGSKHVNNFSSSFRMLSATVHKLFDKFFENETEFDEFSNSDMAGFEFNDSIYDSQKLQHIVAIRIHNCLEFMMTMLRKGFPVAKEIKPLEVLNIIRRGTSMHHCVSSKDVNSVADFQFSLLLNNIQIQLLQLLRVFIIWLQANSLPFSFMINKVLVDCLKRLNNCDCFRTHWLYKEAVHKVLHHWIRISKCSFHPHFQNQLISCILTNTTPIKSQISLTMIATSGKNKSKLAQHKAVTDRIIAGRQENTNLCKTEAEQFVDGRICSLALDTLKYLLTSSYLKIRNELLEDVYKCVLGTLNEINTCKLPHPYTRPECQAKLYEVLVSFYDQDTQEILPPLQLTLDILNKGANSYNRHISIVCEEGLRILEKLCQPLCPSLYTPEMFSTRQDGTQKVQIFDKEVEEMLVHPVEIDLEKSSNTLGPEFSMEVSDPPEIEKPDSTPAESITILDVRIVKPPSLNLIGKDIEKEEELEGLDKIDDSQISVNEVAPQESTIDTEINILRDEVMNYSTVDLGNTISDLEVKLNDPNIELEDSDDENVLTIDVEAKEVSNGEPPSKKYKSDGSEDVIDEKVVHGIEAGNDKDIDKNEDVDNNEEFQNSFVDEVKDY